ncbi:MAG: dTDP-4-dehydrorhamnose reductase [Verrucomicrobiota bacterium]|nr:dTDP-4-dehydrorhamnose reductase [Verrucomicrobiota bacterium]
MTDLPRRRIIIVGAGGRLGAALAREYQSTFTVVGFNHAQLDLADEPQLRATLAACDFDVLVNCAAQTNVDRCETHPQEAFALNAHAPEVLAEICLAKTARLIHISTDYVFDGAKTQPYSEDDEAAPVSAYGESKRAGEQRVLAVNPQNLVARVSWVFGPDRPSFVDWVVQQARTHERVDAVADKFATPSYTLDLADLLRPLLADFSVGGLLHLANAGQCSWREYGQWALDCCAAEGVPLRTREVGAVSLADMKNFIARRPLYSVLATAKYERVTGRAPRDWREAVSSYVRDYVKPRLPV